MKKITLLSLTVLAALALVACSDKKTSQESAASTVSTTTSEAASTTPSGDGKFHAASLDGTYTLEDEDGDKETLKLSAGKGSLTKVDEDGEKEVETVTVNEDSTMIIGDSVKRFSMNGKELILDDADGDLDSEQIFKKK